MGEVHWRDALGLTFDDETSGPTSVHTASDPPAKHDTHITVSNGVATVVVLGTDGSTTALHPQEEAHHITKIWVANQDDELMGTIDIPAGTTKLQAWEFCNLHGLYTGASVEVHW